MKVTKINQQSWNRLRGLFFWDFLFRALFFSTWDFLLFLIISFLKNFFKVFIASSTTQLYSDEKLFFCLKCLFNGSHSISKRISKKQNFNQIKPSTTESKSGIENFNSGFKKNKSELRVFLNWKIDRMRREWRTFVFFMHFNLTHSLDIIKCTNESEGTVWNQLFCVLRLGFHRNFFLSLWDSLRTTWRERIR